MQPAEESTKTELARAARDISLTEGLTGVIHAPCRQGLRGIGHAIYRHYHDKDALVARAVLDGFRLFASYLLDALEQRTPLERIRSMGQRYVDFSRQHSQYYRLMFMTDCAELGMTELDEASEREISGTFQMLQDRVLECQNAGLFKAGAPDALAASVWASLHGLASLMLTGNLGQTPGEATQLIDLHLSHIEASLLS